MEMIACVCLYVEQTLSIRPPQGAGCPFDSVLTHGRAPVLFRRHVWWPFSLMGELLYFSAGMSGGRFHSWAAPVLFRRHVWWPFSLQ